MGTVMWWLGAVVLGWVVFTVGMSFVRSFGTLLPPPPPAGEMRKVNLKFRCTICGTEVKMTSATDDLPEPPRHCMEDMQLITPIE